MFLILIYKLFLSETNQRKWKIYEPDLILTFIGIFLVVVIDRAAAVIALIEGVLTKRTGPKVNSARVSLFIPKFRETFVFL